MTTLTDQVRTDLTAAMKDRDQTRTGALRMLLAAFSEAETAPGATRPLPDDAALKVIASQVKRRVEAAEAFSAAGRDSSAASELAERDVLAAYLPAELDDTELAGIVAATLSAEGLSAPSDMGAAMRAVNAKVAGRAAGGRVAAAVKAALAS